MQSGYRGLADQNSDKKVKKSMAGGERDRVGMPNPYPLPEGLFP